MKTTELSWISIPSKIFRMFIATLPGRLGRSYHFLGATNEETGSDTLGTVDKVTEWRGRTGLKSKPNFSHLDSWRSLMGSFL